MAGQLRDDGCGVVGLVDGVPVAVELPSEEGALLVVCADDQERVLCRWFGVLQGAGRHVVTGPAVGRARS
jgi:hypothetical protein